MRAEERAALDTLGYVILFGVFDENTLTRFVAEGKRLLEQARRDPTYSSGGTLHADLPVSDDSPFASVWQSAAVSEAVAHIVGAPRRPTRMDFRSPQPGYGAQMLHRDWPQPGKPGAYAVATVLVALCDFVRDNGATRVVPGSQHLPGTPKLVNADTPHTQEVVLQCPAGSAIVLNGHIWHSGTRNVSERPRDSLQVIFQR